MTSEMRTDPRHWIFIRGLARGQGHWGFFAEKFQVAFPEDHIEHFDLPGNGLRYEESSPRRLEDYIDDIRSKRQVTDRPVMILAMSFGAMLTLKWMQDFPKEIEKAYLINTSNLAFSPFYRRLQPKAFFNLIQILAEKDLKQRELKILDLTTSKQKWKREEFKKLLQFSSKYPTSKVNALNQILAASQAKILGPFRPDVELICGAEDKMVHPTCSIKMAQSWKKRLHLHPWAGHDLPLDDPEWLIQILSGHNPSI